MDAITADELLVMCFRDRFSLIIPHGLEKTAERLLDELIPKARVTGILIQQLGSGKFYHATQANYVQDILVNGFKVREFGSRDAECLSFDGGVVYSYQDPDKLKLPDNKYPPIIEIEYSGPWLQSIYEEDKPDELFGTCLLYPQFITGARPCNPAKTNHFNKMRI